MSGGTVFFIYYSNNTANEKKTSENVYEFYYRQRSVIDTIMRQNIERFMKKTGQMIYLTRNIPPLTSDLGAANTPEYDIVYCLTSGSFSIFRDWPFAREFEHSLKVSGWTSFNAANIPLGPHILSVIKKAKAWVVVETGLAHYAAQFAHKALLLVSGRAHADFWSIYNYNHLFVQDIPCRNCFLSGQDKSRCPLDIACMKMITVAQVIDNLKTTMMRNSL